MRMMSVGLALMLLWCAAAHAALVVTDLGRTYEPDAARVMVLQLEANAGGNTSVRNTDREHLEWKMQGYFMRNRDLGQVFTAARPCWLDALVLCTGPADAAVLAGAPKARVFVQLFEVGGVPTINDNGTPPGSQARHGFSTNHRCDDFLEGVTYTPLRTVKGGVFPDIPPTRDSSGKPTGDRAGNLRYMRWDLTGDDEIKLEEGKQYAFMIGFEEPGSERGFTLANASAAGTNAAPSLTDRHDLYHGGWGLRREGDGTLPPTRTAGDAAPADVAIREKLIAESLFKEDRGRYALSPTTDGYPDVDTYRDLRMAVEVHWQPPR